LLPCFSDFRLTSIRRIWDEFIIELENETKGEKELIEAIKQAQSYLNGYEAKMRGIE
jgi:hypothetical protein